MIYGLHLRVWGVSLGAGSIVAGVVFWLISFVPGQSGLAYVGVTIVVLGLILGVVGAVGFVRHGSARKSDGPS